MIIKEYKMGCKSDCQFHKLLKYKEVIYLHVTTKLSNKQEVIPGGTNIIINIEQYKAVL